MTEKERLVKLMDELQVNAKSFAEEVGIQPGTISNIMKERNKPSLEVLQRVLVRYSQVNPEWLICGTGSMWRQKNDSQQTLFDVTPIIEDAPAKPFVQPAVQPNAVSQPSGTMVAQMADLVVKQTNVPPRKVQKITILFDDGTFQELY